MALDLGLHIGLGMGGAAGSFSSVINGANTTITDLGGGWAAQFRKALGDKWVVVDHHQIPEQEILTDDSGQILNAWKYGIDGGIEVPAGGMAYMVATALFPKKSGLPPSAATKFLSSLTLTRTGLLPAASWRPRLRGSARGIPCELCLT